MMNIASLQGDLMNTAATGTGKDGLHKTPRDASQNFAEVLSRSLSGVNEAILQSEEKAQGLVNGQIENLHDVMIAAERASMSLQMAVQVRNKVVEAYHEVMRMQV